ncbi:MAG: branched-chain amino acid transaminase [Candidatus Rhabdochlamydia sp.]
MSNQKGMMPYAFFRNEIVPFQEATISIASHSLQYGTSCFGGIRGYFHAGKVRVFRLQDNYERLTDAAKILGMNIQMTWENFQEVMERIVKVNAPQSDFYIRPFLFSEDQVLTPRFDIINFDLAIYMSLFGHYFEPSKGLRLMISSWRKISDAAMSTKAKVGGFYVNSALAATDARQNGYDDALMMDDQGNIVEASAANLFLVYRGKVIMPEVGSAMLEGITRRTALEFLEEEGIKVSSERIDRSMVYTCDELILTGTAAQIAFVQSVDGRVITSEKKPGPICQLLRKKLAETIQGKHPKSFLWLTEYTGK